MKVYESLGNAIAALRNCEKSGNQEWAGNWRRVIRHLVDGFTGGGLDHVEVDMDRSDGIRRVVLRVIYHVMDSVGGYDGYAQYIITVRPMLIGSIDIRVSGRDRDGLKEYIGDTMYAMLTDDVDHGALVRRAIGER